MPSKLHIWVKNADVTPLSASNTKNRFLYASFRTSRTLIDSEVRTTTDRANNLKPEWNQYLRLDMEAPILDVEVCIRDCGPKFLSRRRSSAGSDASKKKVKRGHSVIALGVIPVANLRRGMASPFMQVDLNTVGKHKGQPAGSVTLRCQLQYPESLVLAPTPLSKRMLSDFYTSRTPRLVIVTVDRVRHLKALDPPSMFGRSVLGHSFFVEIGWNGGCKEFQTPETNCFGPQPVEWGCGCWLDATATVHCLTVSVRRKKPNKSFGKLHVDVLDPVYSTGSHVTRWHDVIPAKSPKDRPPGENTPAVEMSVQVQSHTSVIIPPDISVQELAQHSKQLGLGVAGPELSEKRLAAIAEQARIFRPGRAPPVGASDPPSHDARPDDDGGDDEDDAAPAEAPPATIEMMTLLRAASRDVSLLPRSPLGMHIMPLQVHDASARVCAIESVFIAEIYRGDSGEVLPAERAGFQVGDILIGLQGREFVDYQDAVTQITKCCQSVSPQQVSFKVKHAPGCLGSTAPRVGPGGHARMHQDEGGLDPKVSVNQSVAECKDNGGARLSWTCASCTLINEGFRAECSVCGTSRPPRPPSLPMEVGVSAVSKASASVAVAAAKAGSVRVGRGGASVGVLEKKAGKGVVGRVERAKGGAGEIRRVDSEGLASVGSDVDLKGDWWCLSCSQFNEGWRSSCNACLTARFVAASVPLPSPENKRPSLGMVADPSALDLSTTDSDCEEEMFQGVDFSPPSCPPPPDTPLANMEDELQNQLRRLSVYNAGGD